MQIKLKYQLIFLKRFITYENFFLNVTKLHKQSKIKLKNLQKLLKTVQNSLFSNKIM